jgi:hypothetical protein
LFRYILTGSIALSIGVVLGIGIGDLANRKQIRAARAQVAELSEALHREFKDFEESQADLPTVAERDETAQIQNAKIQSEADESVATPATKEEVTLEELSSMTGREWKDLDNAKRSRVAALLAMAIYGVDQQLRSDSETSIPQFLDSFYEDEGNANTKVAIAIDDYMQQLRGVLLIDQGAGNKTTDSFEYDGDGYVLFQPRGESVYAVSAYDDASGEIVAANVITMFEDAEPTMSRLRVPAGNYYLQVTAGGPWSLHVINRRGLQWLKRSVEAAKNSANDAP